MTDEQSSRLPADFRRSVLLFALTAASVFYTAWTSSPGYEAAHFGRAALIYGAQFTGALLSILLAHELGHYVAARIHGVPASLPYFIPMPYLSPFGTMGAVIRMSGRIPTRKALLDIGASGPLAGLTVAIPMYLWGAAHSSFVPLLGKNDGIFLGESILTKLFDRIAVGPTPEGMDLMLSPVAFAAWAGLFVTMINLLPVGQLDGGHVAYALFGPRQDKHSVIVHRSLLALFFVSVASFAARDLRAGIGFTQLGRHLMSSMFWLVWFEVLGVIGSLSQPPAQGDADAPVMSNGVRIFGLVGLIALAWYGQNGDVNPLFWLAWFAGLGLLLAMERKGGSLRATPLLDHPPTSATPLTLGRKIVAVITLLFFALLFMPSPMVM
ncbi:MAG: site-2 protease family protein [Polyangiaceae bacterium]